MANEAVIVELLGNEGDVIEVTVADGATIEKGTLLKLSDPRTGAATSADGDILIGIAATEKVASDGQTTLGVYTNGIFDIKDSGAGITVGLPITVGGANLVKQVAAGEAEGGTVCGYALETASASEVIQCRIKV